jgi:histidine triad (HIT) family protein
MTGSSCVFCKIIAKEIAGTIVAQNEHAVAFRDLRPAAPTHVLVVPRKHVASLIDSVDEDVKVLGHLMLLARDVAKKEGLEATGYRIAINNGAGVGQSVFHLHLHVLGGRAMSWPPG